MKTKILLLVVLFAGTSLIFNSCKKESEIEDPVYSTEAAQDNALADNLFNDAQKQIDDTHKKQDASTKSITDSSAYPIITIIPGDSTTQYIWKAIIDFGTDGVQGNDGRIRKGKIEFTTTGRYIDEGTVITGTLIDYSVDNYLIEGTKRVENMGKNANQQTYFNVDVTNGKITDANGAIRTWESHRVRTWVVGENTTGILGIFDDEYDITGSANGITASNKTYTITITEPLRVKVFCKWIQDGNLSLEVSGSPTIYVDYGVGGTSTCDNQAKATISGQDYTFYMH